MSESNRNYKFVLFLLKLLMTIGLCAVIFWKVDWRGTWNALQHTNLLILIVVFAGMILNVFISSLKWKILLSIHLIRFELGQLYKYYFTASFFNNFLPSTIGGDSYRIYKTFRNPTSKAGAVTSVLVERITGILALMFIGFIGGIVSYLQTGNEISRIVVVIGLFVSGILISIVLVLIFSVSPLQRLIRKYLPSKIKKIVEHFGDYRSNLSKTFIVASLSLFFQFFLLCYRFLLIYAVGASVSIFDLAVVVAVSTIIALAPISLNGIGLLDGSFIYLLVGFGVSYEHAFIVMLLIRALSFLLSFVGGVFYFFDRKSLQVDTYKPHEIQTSQ